MKIKVILVLLSIVVILLIGVQLFISPQKKPQPSPSIPVFNNPSPSASPTSTTASESADTRPTQYAETQIQQFKQANPDMFLANQLPYSTHTFSVVFSGYKKTPIGHYYFTVTLKGADQNSAKNDFLEWLHSLGLVDAQIQNLDIYYNP